MERKFTKEHNDLDWLFPEVPNAYAPFGEPAFDEFEKHAENLFESAHGDQETFTKADVIDAFMKGASLAQQLIGFGASQKEYLNNFSKKFGKSI